MAKDTANPKPGGPRPQIFISYAHKDNDPETSEVLWLNRVLDHLTVLQLQDKTTLWTDKNIKPGQEWHNEVNTALESANVALLLISQHFIGSEFIQNSELPVLLRRAKDEKSLTIIPIHIRACNWELVECNYPDPRNGPNIFLLSDFQSANKPHKPFNVLDEGEVDRILKEIVRQVAEVLKNIGPTALAQPQPKSVHHNLPWEKNPWFTGRAKELAAIQTQLVQTQKAAIYGIGGVGKTQTAVQYGYNHLDDYNHIFWVRAQNENDILDGYGQIATILGLGVASEANIEHRARVVKAHLENPEAIQDYLVIYDNGDDVAPVETWRPHNAGHILLTSRATNFDKLNIVSPVEIKTLPPDDAKTFLLKRAGIDLEKLSKQEHSTVKSLVQKLDALPLALEQAGAYIKEKKVNIQTYAEAYENRRLKILEKGKKHLSTHPESVATTWLLNFEQIKKNAAAAEVLYFSAFTQPDQIPFELLSTAPEEIGPAFTRLYQEEDELAVNEALSKIERFSLVRVDPQEKSYTIHRLVQEVIRSQLSNDENENKHWAERFVKAFTEAFPEPDFENWAGCERLIEQAPALLRWVEEFDLESAEAARSLNQVGYYLKERGRYQDVEGYYQKALSIHKNTLGEEHQNTATSLNNLADLYITQGRYDEAEPLYKQALEIRKRLFGLEHTATATSLNNLAALFYVQGRYDEAEPLFAQVVEIQKKVSGLEHPITATSLNNLALLYKTAGRYDEAEPLYKQALEIRKRLFGLEHPDMAASLNNLAELYRVQDRYSEAEPLYEQALEIDRKTLGPEHTDTATDMNNLASLYESQGRYDEAEPMYKQAVEILEKSVGPDHPNTIAGHENWELCRKKMSGE
ncbi:MAG: tetratricopeptide repeat protein [Leptospirales bacterium]